MLILLIMQRVSDVLKVSLRTVKRLSSKGVAKNVDFQSHETSESTMEAAESTTKKRKNTMIQIHQNVVRNRIYAMYSAGINKKRIIDITHNISSLLSGYT